MQRVGGAAWFVLAVLAPSGILAAEEPDVRVADKIVVGQAAGPAVSVELEDVTLLQAAATLSRMGGQPVILDARLATGAKLHLTFRELSLEEAVDALKDTSGAQVSKLMDGGYLIYRPDEATAGAATPAPAAALVRASIRLEWAKPSDIARRFGGDAVATGFDGLLRGGDRATAPGPPSAPRLALPDGISSLVGLDLISSLIVRGTPEAIAALRELVRPLDVAPPVVVLDVRLVSLSDGALAALPEAWLNAAAGWTPGIVRQADAAGVVGGVVRQNRGRVQNLPLSTREGELAECPFADDAALQPQILRLVARAVAGEPAGTYALHLAVAQRPAPQAALRPIVSNTVRVAAGEAVVARLGGTDTAPVLAVIAVARPR